LYISFSALFLFLFFALQFFVFQAEDGIRDFHVTGVQTCALPISRNKSQVFAPEIGDGERFEAGAQKRPSARHSVSDFTFPAGTRWDAPENTELTGKWGGAERTTLKKGRMIVRNGVLTEPVTLAAAWTQKGQMQQYFYGDRESLMDSRGQKISEFYF